MALHHIIPRHEWKVRFGNLRKFSVPDNMVNLTTEQHAQVHLHYFNEITHIEYARIASRMISGQMGKEEGQRAAAYFHNKGKKHKPSSRLKMIGNKNGLGGTASRGFKYSPEQNKQKSIRTKGVPKRKVTCPRCGKMGGNGAMGKWHFDNCKNKGKK